MAVSPCLVAFGVLRPWSSDSDLHALGNSIRRQECLAPLLSAVNEIVAFWEALLAAEPLLKDVDGLTAAQQLRSWVLQGAILEPRGIETNLLRMPLTVIWQLSEYLEYTQQQHVSHATILEYANKAGGIVGFCAGLLSALAVAGATDEASIGSNGAAAVFLAFAIGVFVDLDAFQNGPTSCLALRWKPQTDGMALAQGVLARHEQAYLSIRRGQHDATVTVPSFTVPDALRDFAATGISALRTGLTGRFHTSRHQQIAEKVVECCAKYHDISFAGDQALRSNTDGNAIPFDKAAITICREILSECSDWQLTLSEPVSRLRSLGGEQYALAIGSSSILSSLPPNIRIVRTADNVTAAVQADPLQNYPPDAVAVVGMSCKFPGADSPDEFWELLKNGTSMAQQVPSARWPETISARGNSAKGGFWGNFIEGYDCFDHKFFKKSSREAASMDPQQRLLLQCAYEALDMAGYFSWSSQAREREVGCYLGMCAVDYDFNVASHTPNAFSTLGTLRAFHSGKISHFFGWSGPSITIDTACSASAVAIHTACRALQASDCKYALAGGIALFTSPYLYENLSAAHFLSPSGQSKSFDAAADGYCRGEGLGMLVLKKLSLALAEGDEILTVIGGSAVNQNDSCVPITVPHAPSQGNLYSKAIDQAGISPSQVSFVEAHGTVFWGAQRKHPLLVSSVKGNIGHLEGASGVAAVIKAILQMKHRTVARQGSFRTLNPKIGSPEANGICVPTSNQTLPQKFITACVNNYGAAGSNTTLILMEPPKTACAVAVAPPSKYPMFITANSQASLEGYCRKLAQKLPHAAQAGLQLADVAYQLSKRQNHDLPWTVSLVASDLHHFAAELNKMSAASSFCQKVAPTGVVLAFGGQNREYVGLNRQVYEHFALLRSHLDRCDAILRSIGYPGLYPAIFQSEPISDVTALHTAMFSLQYASAKAWIDCGLSVSSVIGHSLGQLTALTVSGVLTLGDGLRFVGGRAALMKIHWGEEPGSMILVDATLQAIASLKHSLEIACYNGPTAHVLVGTRQEVDNFEAAAAGAGMKHKRLHVTHGFHSKFTEPMIAPLKELASTLRFNQPTIPIETCSAATSWAQADSDLLAEHTRTPVYFAQAVQRIANARGSCSWVEVGSDSGITSMARGVLGHAPQVAGHHFQPISLSKPSAVDSIVDATIQLWNRGHVVRFWGFHSIQSQTYQPFPLPAYQWEKNKHWLDLKSHDPVSISSEPTRISNHESADLLTLLGKSSDTATFKVNPRSDEYKELVSGHVVAGSPLCPATVDIELAARACRMAYSQNQAFLLGISHLQIDAPLGMAADKDLTLTLSLIAPESWDFSLTSKPSRDQEASPTSHVAGTITMRKDVDTVDRELSIFERLTGLDMVSSLFNDLDAELVRGSSLYKMFARVVEYSGAYRGLRCVAARSGRIGGIVKSIPEFILENSITQPALVDSWMQVSGIHANSFNGCAEDEVCVFTRLEYMQFGPAYVPPTSNTPSSWTVFSNITSKNNKEFSNDIFVFDSDSQRLVVFIRGAIFNKLRLKSLNKILSRLNEESSAVTDGVDRHDSSALLATSGGKTISKIHDKHARDSAESVQGSPPKSRASAAPTIDERVSLTAEVSLIFEKVAEIAPAVLKGHMTVDDLGVDSLMMLEIVTELTSYFGTDLPVHEMEGLTTIDSLVDYLQGKGCVSKRSPEGIRTPHLSMDSSSSTSAAGPTTPTGQTSFQNSPVPPHAFEQLAALLQEHLELEIPPTCDANLADLGLDSLLAIELQSDVEKMFKTTIDLYKIDETSTVEDLARLASIDTSLTLAARIGGAALVQDSPQASSQYPQSADPVVSHRASHSETLPSNTMLPDVGQVFLEIRFDFDVYSREEGFTDFWSAVYPSQEQLVLSYIVDAFKKLGCDLSTLSPRTPIPVPHVLDKHTHLLNRMHKILSDGGYIEGDSASGYMRTTKPLLQDDPQSLLERIKARFPAYAPEHKLLNVTAAQLAECLTGKVDPLSILFANKTNRKLLADVYEMAPMCRAATRLLASYMVKAFPPSTGGRTFHFFEVGGGTGGTMRYLVDFLTQQGIDFTYTFTDISSALVSQVKKTMGAHSCMRYATFNCEVPPMPQHLGKYDCIISTNCVHATGHAASSLSNLRAMLRPDGVMALVEFTNGMYWFDLVYGLLDGWWLFSDGRSHALADTAFWERSLLTAGFKHVSWSDGDTAESRTLRLLCGFNGDCDVSHPPRLSRRAGVPLETVTWKTTDDCTLKADIYYPQAENGTSRRPVALLLHGGGHVLFSRRDIHMKHIKNLLEHGYLPISFDYRLCPEMTLAEGPVTDAGDALEWVRSELPSFRLSRSDVQVDCSRVAAVGWSAGGHLCLTLGYSAMQKGIAPPEAILAFYCPSNFEASCWKRPIYPKTVAEPPSASYDLLEGVQDRPIVGYKPNGAINCPMTLSDPRWRFIIHYNWKAQLVPLLIHGLPTKTNSMRSSAYKNWAELPAPTQAEVQRVSPYAQIVKGRYQTPTCIVHGDQDDLIPWQQSRDTIAALVEQKVEGRFVVAQGAGHAFDLWADEDPLQTGWAAIYEGYDFIDRYIFGSGVPQHH